jgi:hypothetical protein
MIITFITILPNKMNLIKQISWRRISQSEIRNSAAAEKNWNRKAKAGKNFYPVFAKQIFGAFPPTPFPRTRAKLGTGLRFLPARAIGFQNSEFGFSSKNVRTSFKKHRIKYIPRGSD